jgi:DNA-binding XRE family transcriptional regulator
MPRTDKPYETGRSGELAKLRVRAGLQRASAARELDIADKSLANIESGRARASDELLEQMAEAYRVAMQTVRRAYRADRNEFIARERL